MEYQRITRNSHSAQMGTGHGDRAEPGVVVEAHPVQGRAALRAGVAHTAQQGPEWAPVELPGAQEVKNGVVAPAVVAQRRQRSVPPDQQPPLACARLEWHVVVYDAHLRCLAACASRHG